MTAALAANGEVLAVAAGLAARLAGRLAAPVLAGMGAQVMAAAPAGDEEVIVGALGDGAATA